MPTTMKGPAIFLAQFAGDAAPYNSFSTITKWAGSLGYKGVQIPTWDARLFDLAKAASSKTYCDEIAGIARANGVAITELSTHLQGQLVAVNPAYDAMFDGFTPEAMRGNPKARQAWAVEQLKLAAQASRHLGLDAHVSFTGALAWPFVYPWPQRPAGLVETAFAELGRRWRPILDAFDAVGVDVGYEIHPGEDVFDGATFEMFLEATGNHPRCAINYDPSHFVLQHLDYLAFVDIYHERIKAFHVKDAELNPTGRQGVYSGFQPWLNRAGRFRSLGDGQVDFAGIFSKLATYGYKGWAVLEWECCLKAADVGAAEGAPFIAKHIIPVTDKAFDDFASSGVDQALVERTLGLA
jgi:sugar phosphate isomerase/epimerase